MYITKIVVVGILKNFKDIKKIKETKIKTMGSIIIFEPLLRRVNFKVLILISFIIGLYSLKNFLFVFVTLIYLKLLRLLFINL